MTPNNNTSILPFYSDVKYQNHRKDYANGEIYSLVSPVKTILPFQIMREYISSFSPTILLYKGRNGDSFIDITTQVIQSGLSIAQYQSENISVIKYNGVLPMVIDMVVGEYYISVSDGTDTFYSDVFTSVSTVEDCLKIEYFDFENFEWDGGVIDYANGYKNIVYIQTELGKPAYPIEEEAEKRDGHVFIKKQVSEKTFKFNFLASEYLLDAMRIIRMSDNIIITNKGQEYSAVEFLITETWLPGGFTASVIGEFQSDTIIKKKGAGYVGEKGDYNIDYNNDHKIN